MCQLLILSTIGMANTSELVQPRVLMTNTSELVQPRVLMTNTSELVQPRVLMTNTSELVQPRVVAIGMTNTSELVQPRVVPGAHSIPFHSIHSRHKFQRKTQNSSRRSNRISSIIYYVTIILIRHMYFAQTELSGQACHPPDLFHSLCVYKPNLKP